MASNKGIFTHRFLNFASISNYGRTIGFSRVNLSGNGGALESWVGFLSTLCCSCNNMGEVMFSFCLGA